LQFKAIEHNGDPQFGGGPKGWLPFRLSVQRFACKFYLRLGLRVSIAVIFMSTLGPKMS